MRLKQAEENKVNFEESMEEMRKLRKGSAGRSAVVQDLIEEEGAIFLFPYWAS